LEGAVAIPQQNGNGVVELVGGSHVQLPVTIEIPYRDPHRLVPRAVEDGRLKCAVAISQQDGDCVSRAEAATARIGNHQVQFAVAVEVGYGFALRVSAQSGEIRFRKPDSRCGDGYGEEGYIGRAPAWTGIDHRDRRRARLGDVGGEHCRGQPRVVYEAGGPGFTVPVHNGGRHKACAIYGELEARPARCLGVGYQGLVDQRHGVGSLLSRQPSRDSQRR